MPKRCAHLDSQRNLSKIAQFNSQANTNANADDRHHSANRTYTHTYICYGYVCACYIQYIVYVYKKKMSLLLAQIC